jgi:hypothetical protein
VKPQGMDILSTEEDPLVDGSRSKGHTVPRLMFRPSLNAKDRPLHENSSVVSSPHPREKGTQASLP